ncbi:MAG: L-2-amino-thiazoline-4-carboxylic acid hydrolase [Candidatus Hodarchaeota archaeon]
MTKAECARQVRQMGSLMGLLYLHFAKTLLSELGEKEGKDLILKAVTSYGAERGQAIREAVEQAGLELTVENYYEFSDLPSLGWEATEEGTIYCCYAEPWIQRGEEELGQLYCEVDVAKLNAYNPDLKVKRTKTLLEGDSFCQYIIE